MLTNDLSLGYCKTKIAQDVIKKGYSKFSLRERDFSSIKNFIKELNGVDEEYKKAHANQNESDGFMGSGSEYSNTNNNPDICERFCYWRSRSQLNKASDISDHPLYKAAESTESMFDVMSNAIIQEIFNQFNKISVEGCRNYSYLQACMYKENHAADASRLYAQEPHEDGHFLTFITATDDGLSLHNGKLISDVQFGENELIVFSGSSLSMLSDYSIKATYHSVRNSNKNRVSVIYFLNPDLSHYYESFYRNRKMNFKNYIEGNHQSFGNAEIFDGS